MGSICICAMSTLSKAPCNAILARGGEPEKFERGRFIPFEAAGIGHLSLPGDSPPGSRIRFEQCVPTRHFSQNARGNPSSHPQAMHRFCGQLGAWLKREEPRQRHPVLLTFYARRLVRAPFGGRVRDPLAPRSLIGHRKLANAICHSLWAVGRARAVFKAAVHHSRSSISAPAGASSSASPASTSPSV